jgi:hypothetical protein
MFDLMRYDGDLGDYWNAMRSRALILRGLLLVDFLTLCQ